MSHDFREEARLMAATNERLCRVVLAADDLVKALGMPADAYGHRAKRIRDALDAYTVVRNGQ